MTATTQEKRGRGRRYGSTNKATTDDLIEAKTRKELALAELRELEVRQRRGELVEAAAVEAEWRAMAATIRAGMLAVASRVAPAVVGLTDEREIEDAVVAAIHEAMESIANVDSDES